MKRKEYVTRRERMVDQIIGFWAFPLVNVVVWIISQRIDSLALPWLVNIIVLILAYLFRPEFGIGYITFIAVALIVVTASSALFVAACFVSILSAAVLGDLAVLLFAILMLVGLSGLARFAIDVFRNWWSSYKDNSQ